MADYPAEQIEAARREPRPGDAWKKGRCDRCPCWKEKETTDAK